MKDRYFFVSMHLDQLFFKISTIDLDYNNFSYVTTIWTKAGCSGILLARKIL